MLTTTQVAPSEKPVVGFLNSGEKQEKTEGASFSALFSMVSSESELSESSEDGKAYNGLVDNPVEFSEAEAVPSSMLTDSFSTGPIPVIDSALISSEAEVSSVGMQLQALVSQLASREHMPKGHAKEDVENHVELSLDDIASVPLFESAVVDDPEISLLEAERLVSTSSDISTAMSGQVQSDLKVASVDIEKVSPEMMEEAVAEVKASGSEVVAEALTEVEVTESDSVDVLNEMFTTSEHPDDPVTQESLLFVNSVSETMPHESVAANTQASSQAKIAELSVDEVAQTNLDEKIAVEQVSTVNAQAAINPQGTVANVAGSATQASTQFTAAASNASSNSVTHWGAQSGEAQPSQNSQGSGQSGQPSGQGQGQANQQQAMMFAQSVQEQKERAIEQQQAVKAVEEAIVKSEERGLLGGAEIASADRRATLPLGLQAINLPVRHPQWGQALGQRVMFMAKNDLQQAQITLNPEKLGKIQVVLQLDKEQVMNVSLTAQSGTTREAIENALPRLREMLEQAGVNLGSVDVSEQKQSSDDDSEASEGDKGSVNSNLAEEDSSVDDSTTVVKSIDGLVDYYV